MVKQLKIDFDDEMEPQVKEKSLYNWCLANKKDYLLEEWSNKNNLSPKEVSYGSNKKFLWKCSKGHEWEASVYHRINGNGCPICANKVLLVGYNDLLTMNPEVASEWHPTRNGGIKPSDVIYTTTKRAWWKCSKCGHEWETSIRERTYRKMSGCPKCSIIKRSKTKNLSNLKLKDGIKNQLLIDEWDYEKNYPLTPNDFTEGSNKSVWWKCKNNHSWEARIGNRTFLGRNCPYCTNQKVLPGFNDFATIHPELLSEWDFEKNIEIDPHNVLSGSKLKVYWRCPVGHSYSATLNHRCSSESTGCPICFSGRQTSFAEQAFYYYIKQVFPDAINRFQNIFGSRFELDIYIPSLNTGIEYDGEAWHRDDTLDRERRKYNICHEHGIRLIRLREKNYPLGSDVADYGFTYEGLYKYDVLQRAIVDLLKFLLFHPVVMPVDVNVERDKTKIYKSIYKIEENSLEKVYPEIAKEWHPTKNGDLKPNMFKPRSDYKAWWLCSKCAHEWQSTIGHRVEGTGCPKCGIIKSALKRATKVAKCDLGTKEIIEIYDSISEAGRQNNINTSNISSVCKGVRPNAGGYYWKYIKQEE